MSDEHAPSGDGAGTDHREPERPTEDERDEPETREAVPVSDSESTDATSEDGVGSQSGDDRTHETDDPATTIDEETAADPGDSSSDDGADEDVHEDIDALRAELDDFRERLKESRAHIEQLESKVEDYERRNSHEHEKIKKYATEDLAGEMLRVKDMLEDAIEMEDLEEGTERRLGAVSRQFDKTITSGSIERIEPEPEDPYDDQYHRMMDKVQTDKYEPEQIVEVLEGGYRANDRVIRPARVRVAAEPSE